MCNAFENEIGYFIRHKDFVDRIYENVNGQKYSLKQKLFNIPCQYKSRKNTKLSSKGNSTKSNTCSLEEQQIVKDNFAALIGSLLHKHLNYDQQIADNSSAVETAKSIYETTGNTLVQNTHGANIAPATVAEINDSNFIFPENCKFYAKEVSQMDEDLKGETYDLILLDPPWWNKYIRRKRKKSGDAYSMIYNNDLKDLPVDKLLAADGLVAVWCTNSQQNYNDLLNNILPQWKLEFVAKWYWVKVTSNGEPICEFSSPPGKQPYERIVFAARERSLPLPGSDKLIVSVPSALHSHKPPLVEALAKFLPENPSCLEVFARYLLPGWTSYGNEVLRFQHESLYQNDMGDNFV